MTDILQKRENVAKNVANENSQDLTSQWKKGELPCGWYWCKCYNEEIKKLYYDGDCFELDDPETKNYYFFLPKDIEEITILKQEPTFEEWKRFIDANDRLFEVVKSLTIERDMTQEENTQLKELLKECREVIEWQTDNYDEKPLIAKIDEALQ